MNLHQEVVYTLIMERADELYSIKSREKHGLLRGAGGIISEQVKALAVAIVEELID